jgi:hypothetical protein
MTEEQQAAYISAQAVCALIKAMGMAAENMQRQQLGQSMVYGEDAFNVVIEEFGIHHNAVIGFFRR